MTIRLTALLGVVSLLLLLLPDVVLDLQPWRRVLRIEKSCSLEHLEKSRTNRVGSGGLLDMARHDWRRLGYCKSYR